VAFDAELERQAKGESSPAGDFSRVASAIISRVTDAGTTAPQAAWWLHEDLVKDLPAPGSVGPLLALLNPPSVPAEVPLEIRSEYARECDRLRLELQKPWLIIFVEWAIIDRKWDAYAFFWRAAPLVSFVAWQAFVEGTLWAHNILKSDSPDRRFMACYAISKRLSVEGAEELLWFAALDQAEGEVERWRREREDLVDAYCDAFRRAFEALPLEALQNPGRACEYARTAGKHAFQRAARLKQSDAIRILDFSFDQVRNSDEGILTEKDSALWSRIPPEINDALWERIDPLLPREASKPRGGRPRIPDRLVMEAIFAKHRGQGYPWRKLPRKYGPQSTVRDRYRLWEKHGAMAAVWNLLK
jgi:hypothetical protein